MKLLLILSTLLLVIACGSSDKSQAPREFSHTFKVIDAKTEDMPEWINEPQEWAEDNIKNSKEFRFFVYDTEPKNSRAIACKIAKANANANIAAEITQFIKQSLATSTNGDPTAMDEKLDEFVETTLAQEVQGFIVGASVYRTYWEKRAYMKEMGADRDYKGFTCAALVKMSKDNIEKAIRRAQRKVEDVANPEVKQNVKQALKDVAEKFNEI